MESAAAAIGGLILGALAWVAANLGGAAGYALSCLLLLPLIFLGVIGASLVATALRRIRGEPTRPFRWR